MNTNLLTTEQTEVKEHLIPSDPPVKFKGKKIVHVRSHQIKSTDSWRLCEIYDTGPAFIIVIRAREKGKNKPVSTEYVYARGLAELIERAAYLHFWFGRSEKESCNVIEKILEWHNTGVPHCGVWG